MMRFVAAVWRTNGWLNAVILACLAAGCGEAGPSRHALTGEATFNGAPIPKGRLFLTPDASQGNDGPQTIVEIRDGRFTASGNRGVLGGPYLVQVQGFDGVPRQDVDVLAPDGAPLFPEPQAKHTFPTGDAQATLRVTGDAQRATVTIETTP